MKGTDVVISRIANSATVAGTANAGGLIGLVQATDDQEGAASVKLTESYNIGEVSAVTAGGLIGAERSQIWQRQETLRSQTATTQAYWKKGPIS